MTGFRSIIAPIVDQNGVAPLTIAINDTFAQLGRQLGANVYGEFANVASAFLVGEVADALNLEGFERGLFTTVGNTVASQLLTNVGKMTGVLPVGAGEIVGLFSGFNPANMSLNVGTALGSFFGSQLGQQIV